MIFSKSNLVIKIDNTQYLYIFTSDQQCNVYISLHATLLVCVPTLLLLRDLVLIFSPQLVLLRQLSSLDTSNCPEILTGLKFFKQDFNFLSSTSMSISVSLERHHIKRDNTSQVYRLTLDLVLTKSQREIFQDPIKMSRIHKDTESIEYMTYSLIILFFMFFIFYLYT